MVRWRTNRVQNKMEDHAGKMKETDKEIKKMSGYGRGWKGVLTGSLCGLIAAAVFGTAAFAGEAPAVRVGSLLALGTAAPFAAQELGYYEEAGLEITMSEFSDGAAIMEAFAAGELDVALVGIAPAATWYAKGIDLKVVAGTNGGGHVLMTRADTGIETLEDLKDRMIASPSVATVTDALMRDEILKKAGLDPDMDVLLISGMKPADMSTALMATKEVDAMITWEPYASQAEAEYGEEIRVLYDAAPIWMEEQDADSFYPGNVVIASGEFIETHGDLLDQFLEIHKKTTEYLNEDPGANELLGNILQLDAAVIEQARTRTDFHWEMDREAALSVLQWSVDLGYLEELPDENFFLIS